MDMLSLSKNTWVVCYHYPCGDGQVARYLYVKHLRSFFKGRIIFAPLYPRGKLTLKPEWGKVIAITFLDTLPLPKNLDALVSENPDTKIVLIDHHFPVIRDFLKDPRLEFSAEDSRDSKFSLRVWRNVTLITPIIPMSALEMVKNLFPDVWSGVPPMMKRVFDLVALADIGELGKVPFEKNWMVFSEETLQEDLLETDRWYKHETSPDHMTFAYSWKLKALVANMQPSEFEDWVITASEKYLFKLMNYTKEFRDKIIHIFATIKAKHKDKLFFLYYFVKKDEKARDFTSIINTLVQQDSEFPCKPIFYISGNEKGVCFQGRFPNRSAIDLDLAELAKSVNPTCGGHAPAATIFLPMDFVISTKFVKNIFFDKDGKLNKEECLSNLNRWVESLIQSKSATNL